MDAAHATERSWTTLQQARERLVSRRTLLGRATALGLSSPIAARYFWSARPALAATAATSPDPVAFPAAGARGLSADGRFRPAAHRLGQPQPLHRLARAGVHEGGSRADPVRHLPDRALAGAAGGARAARRIRRRPGEGGHVLSAFARDAGRRCHRAAGVRGHGAGSERRAAPTSPRCRLRSRAIPATSRRGPTGWPARLRERRREASCSSTCRCRRR